MKRADFLRKLHDEGKLKEVEPSAEIAEAYLQKSDKSLVSAKALLDIGNLEDSVAMAYYAMYHCLVALLFRTGIKCENHSAAIILLQEVFGIDNSQISKAKSERVDKQYYVDFSISKNETGDAILAAEEFKANLKDFIDRLNSEKIREYRHTAVRIISA
jgi:uncharacterized protein (UPF0332 family)